MLREKTLANDWWCWSAGASSAVPCWKKEREAARSADLDEEL